MRLQTPFDPQILFRPELDFDAAALQLFHFQYTHTEIYRRYVDLLGVDPDAIHSVEAIPFLPIRFFKSHQVVAGEAAGATIFESSGTTGMQNSRHYVQDIHIYEQSFHAAFKAAYGHPDQWCIIGLLPSYLERRNASLAYMVQKLIDSSGHPDSGFYLHENAQLAAILTELEARRQPTLLFGVTFALLDLAESHPMGLQHTIIMETGGMKGRRKELVRAELQDRLRQAFSLEQIHSEYGMTELLSQAYSQGQGRFRAPGWMRIRMRDEEDPLSLKPQGSLNRGLINIIDLANIYSCSFIATDDLGLLYPDGSFEVTGRRDHSDLRGCSLLAL
ncbi:acyltransferase [Niabella terrae]